MKIKDLKDEQIRQYLRLNDDDGLLAVFKQSAMAYIKSYTGLSEEKINSNEDITMAYLVLISDFYDNRQYTQDRNYSNKSVDTILGMHCINFIPKR
jgi:DNA packaging protein, QLRG family